MAAETEWQSPGSDARLLRHIAGSLSLSQIYIDWPRLSALAGPRRPLGPVTSVEAAALGLIDGLSLALGILAMRGAWSLDNILEIHWAVLHTTDPWRAGRLRQIAGAYDRVLPLPVLLPSLLRDALQGATLDLEAETTPFEAGARLHQRLMLMKPFAHGNGRVARILTQGVLSTAGIGPVRFEVGDRARYTSVLEQRTRPDSWQDLAQLLREAAAR